MKYFQCRLFDFLKDDRPYGLDRRSSLNDIQNVFDTPKYGWNADPVITIGDLELGPCEGHLELNWLYFGLYPGYEDRERFSIQGKFSERIYKRQLSIINFMKFFLINDIEFSLNTELSWENEQRNIVTPQGDSLFFMSRDGANYYLVKMFCERI